MENVYYIYIHRTKYSKEIFYVGKGKNSRAYSKRNRNVLWQNIANKYGYVVEIIKEKLNENEAFDMEKSLISIYNPRANLTKGGEGTSGFKHCKETVKRRNNINRAINQTFEGKLKKSLAQKEAQNRPEVKAKIKASIDRLKELVINGIIENPWKGHKFTPKQIEQISSKQRGPKGYWYGKTTSVALPVSNLNTGEHFESIKKAAASVGGNYRSLSKAIKQNKLYKKQKFVLRNQ